MKSTNPWRTFLFRFLFLVAFCSILLFISSLSLNKEKKNTTQMDLSSLLPHKQSLWLKKSVRFFQGVSTHFGMDRMVLLTLESKQGDIFQKQSIQAMKEISTKIKHHSAVEQIVSLADTLAIKSSNKSMIVKKIFPDKEMTVQDLKTIRNNVLQDPLLKGSLVSEKGHATMFLALLREKKVQEGILFFEKTIPQFQKQYPMFRWGATGVPLVAGSYPKELVRRLWFPTLLSCFFLFFFYVFQTRSLFLFLWLLGSFVSSVFCMIVILQFQSRWNPLFFFDFRVKQHFSDPWWLAFVFLFVLIPSIATLFSWSLAHRDEKLPSFSSYFLISPAPFTLLLFGLGFGILGWKWDLSFFLVGAWIWIVSFGVVLLNGRLLWSFATEKKKVVLDFDSQGSFFTRLAIVVVFLVPIGFGISSIHYGNSFSLFFPEKSYLQQGEKTMNRHFSGSQPIFIEFKGPLQDPFLLKFMVRISQRIEQKAGLEFPQSVGSLIAHLNDLMNGEPRVPDTSEQVSALWSLLEGQPALKNLVRNELSSAILQVRFSLDHYFQQICSKKPWKKACFLQDPMELFLKIDSYLGDNVFLQNSQTWSSLSPQKKEEAFKRRFHWVAEGVQLRWHAFTKQWVSLARIEKQLRAKPDAPTDPTWAKAMQKKWKQYFLSDECDLELKATNKPLFAKRFLEKTSTKFPLHSKEMVALLVELMEELRLPKDLEGAKYASKSILQKYFKALEMSEIENKTKQVLSFLQKESKATTPLNPVSYRVLKGEIQELWNPKVGVPSKIPRWTTHHSGLHAFVLPVSWGVQFLLFVGFPFLILALFSLFYLRLLSARKAFVFVSPTILSLIVGLGILGWMGVGFDFSFLLSTFLWIVLSISMVWHISVEEHFLKKGSWLFYFLPWIPFFFVGIPQIQFLAWFLFGMMVVCLLFSKLLFRQLSA